MWKDEAVSVMKELRAVDVHIRFRFGAQGLLGLLDLLGVEGLVRLFELLESLGGNRAKRFPCY